MERLEEQLRIFGNPWATLGQPRGNMMGTRRKQGGVSHYDLAIHIKKYLKAKEELWKRKYFTMQKYNFQNIL